MKRYTVAVLVMLAASLTFAAPPATAPATQPDKLPPLGMPKFDVDLGSRGYVSTITPVKIVDDKIMIAKYEVYAKVADPVDGRMHEKDIVWTLAFKGWPTKDAVIGKVFELNSNAKITGSNKGEMFVVEPLRPVITRPTTQPKS